MTWLDDMIGRAARWLTKPQPSSRFAEIDATDTDDKRLSAAGRVAVAEAERLFELDVIDPHETDRSKKAARWRAVISDIIRAAGWGFALPYLGNRKDGKQTKWCGMFAAACWRAAGIDPSMLATFWASTIRLNDWAHGRKFNGKANPKPKTGKRLACRPQKKLTFVPRVGDILVVGDGKPSAGDHICVVASFDAKHGVFLTIEGNGRGIGPDGKPREGIVRRVRPIAQAMWLYRPAAGDLVR